jgi:hypothetical protein
MSDATGPYGVEVEETSVNGETRWITIRARGAEWSHLTPQEAALIARDWTAKYGHLLSPAQ